MHNQPTLLWDFDGTLAKREGHQSGAMMYALDHYHPNHGITIEQIRPLIKNSFPWHTPELSHHHLNTPQIWWQHVENIFFNAFVSAGLQDDIAKKLSKITHEHYINADEFILFPGTIEVLTSLKEKGWQNIVLSNHVPELAQIVAKKGLGKLFSHCITSASIGYEKPNEQAFKFAIELAGNPHEIVMIGDNISADVKGAKNAGIEAILIHTTPDESVEYFAKSIVDVEAILGQLYSLR